MRIRFNYTKYPNSDAATLFSYFANMLLAIDCVVVIPVVIAAVSIIVNDGLTLESFQMALAAAVCIGYIILYLAIKKATIKNESPKIIESIYMEQAAQQQLAKWLQEAESLKQLYPGFNINAEIQNANFRDLLKKGVSVKQAYELIHKDEIQNQ